MARPTLPAVGAAGPGWATTVNNAINDTSDRADQALAQATGVPAVVQADSFAGASDGAKMSAALSYAAAQTHVPWVQLPARIWNTGTTSYDIFYGMRICGAGYEVSTKNQELGNKSTLGIWQTSCGTGANSLLRASTTVQSVTVSNINFYAAGNTSQIFRAAGGNGVYPAVFHNLSLYGGPYFFGNPSEKFLTTQMVFSGHWTVLGYNNTPFTLGGGDCNLWMSGYLNSNSFGAGGGKPIVDLQGLGKTNIGFMYLTNEADWVGLRIQGGADKMCSIFGGAFEGRSQSNLATRPTIDIQGGTTSFFGPWVAQVSGSSGTVQGAIHQSGGTAYFYGGTYHRGAATADTFPFLYQTGGVAQFFGVPMSATGGQIRWRQANGQTVTMAAPANHYWPRQMESLNAAATDLATTTALANDLRQAMINLGLAT